MANVYAAIISDDDYWDGTESWAGETSEANRDTKYSTRRYTSVSAWYTARASAAGSGDDEHGIISGAWAADDTGAITLGAWSSDSTTLYCPLTLPDGTNPARHNGIYGDVSTAHRMNDAQTHLFRNNSLNNFTMDGLQIRNTSGGGYFSSGAVTGTVLRNNVIEIANTSGNGIDLNNAAITAEIYNNVVYCAGSQGAATEGIYIDAVSTALVYNNTVYNWNDGIERDAGTWTGKNNVSFNNVTDIDAAAGTIDYNATDDGTGTNAVTFVDGATAWAANFTAYATYDFTPLDDQLPAAGVGPTTDANVPTTDIIGVTRSGTTCTIGAFEFAAAGGISIPVVMNHLRNQGVA